MVFRALGDQTCGTWLMLTAEKLKALVSYNQETGMFSRRGKRKSYGAGTAIGHPSARDRVQIYVEGRRYYAHRLAWLYAYGEWPTFEIDHIDGDPTNNALRNLRPATRSQNNANSRLKNNNTSGLKGVSLCLHSRERGYQNIWRASITIDGRARNLGRYRTPQEAHAAYLKAAAEAFGEFANAGGK